MKLKGPVATMGVALVAISSGAATAGLLAVAYYMSNVVDQPVETGGTPHELEPNSILVPKTAIELSEQKVANVLPAEEHNSGQSREGLLPGANPVYTAEGGGSALGVASQDDLAPSVNANKQSGLSPDEPAQNDLVDYAPQGPFSDTSGESMSAPEGDRSGHTADFPEAGPGTATSVLGVSSSNREVPLDEAGKVAVQVDGRTDALGSGQQYEGPDANDQVPFIPGKRDLKYPNLSSHLNQLVASVEAGRTNDEKAAEGATIHQGESVAVTIHISGNADEVARFLEDNGGDPRNVGEDYIEAYVPFTLLGPVSERPGVVKVREIVGPEDS